MTSESPTRCHVCGEAIEDQDHLARCNVCFREFHQRWSVKAEHVPECGRPFINPETCAMGFVCNPCDRQIEADDAERAAREANRPQPPIPRSG